MHQDCSLYNQQTTFTHKKYAMKLFFAYFLSKSNLTYM